MPKKNLLTIEDFKAACKKDKYFKGRWAYIGSILKLLKQIEFNTCLELGPYTLPYVKNSDIMDNVNRIKGRTKYIHDASITPWNIEDNKYDLFIATQVWEHLKGHQIEAFKEVVRIANKALLSFPYKWKGKGIHAGIDRELISKWTLGIKPKQVFVKYRRIFYYFEFDKV